MTIEQIEIKPGRSKDRNGSPKRMRTGAGWSYIPRVDITESADGFTIIADIPGVWVDGICIEFENHTLIVHGRVQPRHSHDIGFVIQEYGVGDFDREFGLPETVEIEKVHAEFENGVLTIHLPKVEGARSRRIPVKKV